MEGETTSRCPVFLSSTNVKKWETELQSLRESNARLSTALQESAASIEHWKKQFSACKEENDQLRGKVAEHTHRRAPLQSAAPTIALSLGSLLLSGCVCWEMGLVFGREVDGEFRQCFPLHTAGRERTEELLLQVKFPNSGFGRLGVSRACWLG